MTLLKENRRAAKVQWSTAPYFCDLMRAINMLEEFDRTGIAILFDINYGNVSGRISEMENAGYLEMIPGSAASYDTQAILRNPEYGLRGFIFNYGKNVPKIVQSDRYRKTDLWSEAMDYWREFTSTRVPAEWKVSIKDTRIRTKKNP